MTMLSFIYETKPEAIAAILPPPLEPMDPPIVRVENAVIARSNCMSPFNGSVVHIPCKYKDQVGGYIVHMVMSTDQAIIFGRERTGEPKKYGETSIVKQGTHVEGHVKRLGKEYITISGELNGSADIDVMPKEAFTFFFKFLPACDGSGLEFDPILVKVHNKVHYNWLEQGQGDIKYSPSDHDFLYELEVVNPVALLYGNIDLDPGTYGSKKIASIPAKDFLPYAFGNVDDLRLLNNID